MNALPILVPTGGILEREGEWMPTPAGLCRIRTVVEEVRAGWAGTVFLIGGKRRTGPSEAEVYDAYLRALLAEAGLEAPRIVTDAQSVITNRDILLALPVLERELGVSGWRRRHGAGVRVVSYDLHYQRIRIVLGWLGFWKTERLPSGEERRYSLPMEGALIALTAIDPFFAWTPMGWLAVWKMKRERLRPAFWAGKGGE